MIKSFLKIKQSVLVLFFILNGTVLFSQLDSASVNIHFETEIDSLQNNEVFDVMVVDISVNDIDFLGEIIVIIYEENSDYPLMKVKLEKTTLIEYDLITGNMMNISFPDLSPNDSFRIETIVKNYQGANLPLIISNYNVQ